MVRQPHLTINIHIENIGLPSEEQRFRSDPKSAVNSVLQLLNFSLSEPQYLDYHYCCLRWRRAAKSLFSSANKVRLSAAPMHY
jgi:hypothetical protein